MLRINLDFRNSNMFFKNFHFQMAAANLLMYNRRKPQKNIEDLINNYNSTLQKLTDKYAPLQCKTISLRPPCTLVHKCITPGEKGAQAE